MMNGGTPEAAAALGCGSRGRSLFDKIWDNHVVAEAPSGEQQVYVDRHYLIEGSIHSFTEIETRGLTVRRPELSVAFTDHYAPTNRAGSDTVPEDARAMMETLAENARRHGILHIDLLHREQGIVHVVAPQLGLTLPGAVVACGDSHTTTHGAFGALAFGVGSYETAHLLATQTLWLRKPKQMLVEVEGCLAPGVEAKDLILAVIATIGVGGATGYALMFRGEPIHRMSMEERMTVCNMAVEAGARTGLIAPDAVTFDYLSTRKFAPKGAEWRSASENWASLGNDPDVQFDREVVLDATAVTPTLTWGTSPEQSVPIGAVVPSPNDEVDPARRDAMEAALTYMGIVPGMQAVDIRFDRVFIGSCTNGRLDDLRSAARIMRGRQVTVPTMIVPGSMHVRRMAEQEGLDRIFLEAGCEWLEPGCSMCFGANGDMVAPGERCASTTNRNFRGRQGPGSRTHLMSPAMAAAVALHGHPVDVRDLF